MVIYGQKTKYDEEFISKIAKFFIKSTHPYSAAFFVVFWHLILLGVFVLCHSALFRELSVCFLRVLWSHLLLWFCLSRTGGSFWSFLQCRLLRCSFPKKFRTWNTSIPRKRPACSVIKDTTKVCFQSGDSKGHSVFPHFPVDQREVLQVVLCHAEKGETTARRRIQIYHAALLCWSLQRLWTVSVLCVEGLYSGNYHRSVYATFCNGRHVGVVLYQRS